MDVGKVVVATDRSVTEESLGAWVLKCNPDIWDIRGFLDAGNEVIDNWSVVDNYRSRMMTHGQRVLLWVTGSKRADLPRGFWGSGWVTGRVSPRVETEDDQPTGQQEQVDFWLDRDAEGQVNYWASTDLTIWRTPVTEAEVLAITSLRSMEVIRMRQGSNPSWVTKDELASLSAFLPPWPAMPAEAPTTVVVGPKGAGFGDTVTRALVEAAAIKEVRRYYRSAGYVVQSVEQEKCGWDLTCTSSDGRTLHVEVKGVSGSRPTFLLTRNEFSSMVVDGAWHLAVVTDALSKPRVQILESDAVREAAEPYVYRVDIPGG